jgi:Mor family transcriptional regulator
VANLENERVKDLRTRGFSDKEIAGLLQMDIEIVASQCDNRNVVDKSIDMYSEMQKDLSKLILTEMGKETRDAGIVLNSIKLQAELQEKKLTLANRVGDQPKINKNYLYDRDEAIVSELRQGSRAEDVAKKYSISVLSVKQAIDRVELGLTDEQKQLSPSIISETIGLDRDIRLRIIDDAYKNKLTRQQVRDMVIGIKNERR